VAVQMELCRVLIIEQSDQQMIFLREIGGERQFPIMIGLAEAIAIDRRLQGIIPPRPMTHDLLASTIESLGGVLTRIVIGDLREHTFIATLHVVQGDREVLIDARPSDAIALGVGLGTPIFVADRVLDELIRPPQTKADRLQLLRDRLTSLRMMGGELQDQLENPAFLDQATPDQIRHLENQLKALTDEGEAIQRTLDKYG
jgi:uncharacterized protein